MGAIPCRDIPACFFRGAVYHVYCRVARGEFVFDDEFEAMEFVNELREVRDLDGWRILAWCLMGNHYHLVLKTGNNGLWRSMARLQGRVCRAHSRRHRFLGRIWQSRYRARVIDTNDHYRRVVAYVHLNPVSAGIVDDPTDDVFSGHREIIGSCEPHVIDLRSTLRGFGGGVLNDAIGDYLGSIRSAAEARWAKAGVFDLPRWADAQHFDEIADAERHPVARTFDQQHLAATRAAFDSSTFVQRFESASGYRVEHLASRRRSEQHFCGRIEFTVLAVSRYEFRACDVASLLRKGRNSVTRWLNRGLRLENDDPDFSRRLDQLDATISRRH